MDVSRSLMESGFVSRVRWSCILCLLREGKGEPGKSPKLGYACALYTDPSIERFRSASRDSNSNICSLPHTYKPRQGSPSQTTASTSLRVYIKEISPG